MKELPDGWEWRKVGGVIENIPLTGKKLPNSEYNEEGIIPVVDQGQNLIGGYTNRENLKITTGFPLIGFGDHTRILKFIDFEFVPGADGIKILKPSKEFDPKFFYYALQSSNILDLGYSRHFKILKEVIIPLPPLTIQRQIVAVLEQAEAVMRQRQEADALTGALLQSVFREMFGDPVRNERGWDFVKIRDVTEKSQYGCSVLGMNEGQYPILGMNNITYEGKIDLKNLKYVNISEKEFENFKLESGDILFNRTNAPNLVGKTGLFQNGEDFVFASYLIRLKLKIGKVDPEFLWTFLNSPYMKNKFSGMCKKAVNQANINAQELQNISIPLPPLALQQQFARVVEEVERIREQQLASGKEIEGLCEGLMQRAFAGELTKNN
jgi:type I restriction enzyme S subunit